ncbi:MAG: DUF4359 domain-containing protein [Cellulosilyticum sp.]|nr:DUF4359 domain-containing protein [Cellulosilyticum sp.]
MKKSFTSLILTLLIIAFAFICLETNPTREDYTIWLKKEYIPSITHTSGITEVFAQVIGPTFINESTTTKNYLFFSLYDIHLEQDESTKVLGILDHFFVLE